MQAEVEHKLRLYCERNVLNLAAILMTLSALFSYVNHRFIGLPTTIGVMLISLLLLSLLLILIGELGHYAISRKLPSAPCWVWTSTRP